MRQPITEGIGADVTSRAYKLTRWLMHLFVVLLCITPSVWINVRAQLDLGSGYDMVAAVVGFAVLAPILTLNAYTSARDRQVGLTMVWASVAIVFVCLNTVLALGGYSAIRDKVADARAASMRHTDEKGERLAEARQRIAALSPTSGSASPDMLASNVAALEADRLYLRSTQCHQVTKGDSENFCQRLAAERGRLAAAVEIRRIETEIDRNGWSISTGMERPSAADPQIENLTAITVAIFGVRYDQRLMASMLSVFLALMTEILADIGPVAILFAWSRMGRRREPNPGFLLPQDGNQILAILPHHDFPPQDAEKTLEIKDDPTVVLARITPQDEVNMSISVIPPEALENPSLQDVSSWLGDCLNPGQDGERILYGDAHDHLAKWCKARGKKVVPKSAFTLAMHALGWPNREDTENGSIRYRAKVGGKMWFYGVGLKKQPALRAVK